MGITTGLLLQKAIFNRLMAANVIESAGINGGIFKNRKPKDSQKEDIVVRALTVDAEQIQGAVVNVNIHVPNLKMSRDSTQPDEDRFTAITDIVLAALNDYRGFDYWFTIKVPGLLYPDGDNWFSNIQVEFTSLIQEN